MSNLEQKTFHKNIKARRNREARLRRLHLPKTKSQGKIIDIKPQTFFNKIASAWKKKFKTI